MSGSVGATFIKTNLLASKIPVRKPWLQHQKNTSATKAKEHQKGKKPSVYICSFCCVCACEKKGEREREGDNLENCPRIAGMEPLYNPCTPICGSFAIISGNDNVDACTRVWKTKKDNFEKALILSNARLNMTSPINQN